MISLGATSGSYTHSFDARSELSVNSRAPVQTFSNFSNLGSRPNQDSSAHSNSIGSRESLSFLSPAKSVENVYSLESIRSNSPQALSVFEGGIEGGIEGNPRSDSLSPESSEKDVEQEIERLEQEQIKELAARDREVRTHEQAHAAAGGQYAGAPRYDFERGPDGVSYAVGGEVSIDVSKEATPEETLRKAQVVRRAATAPAEPSAQDRAVAAQATRIEAEAVRELAIERNESSQIDAGDREQSTESSLELNDDSVTESSPASYSSDRKRDVSSYESIASITSEPFRLSSVQAEDPTYSGVELFV